MSRFLLIACAAGALWLSALTTPVAAARSGADGADRPGNRAQAAAEGQRDAKPRAEAQRRPRVSVYDNFANVCQFTDGQRTQLAELVKQRAAALKQWDSEHGDALKAADAARKQAGKDREANPDAYAAARSAHQALRNQRREIEQQYWSQMQALATPAQLQRWNAYNMANGMASRFRKVKPQLSDEQKTAMQTMCLQALPRIDSLQSEDEKKAARKQLQDAIAESVLTAEQKASIAPKPKPEGEGNAGRGNRKPKPDREAEDDQAAENEEGM